MMHLNSKCYFHVLGFCDEVGGVRLYRDILLIGLPVPVRCRIWVDAKIPVVLCLLQPQDKHKHPLRRSQAEDVVICC